MRPEDIVSYPLKQALRGYAIEQVDDLLDRVADEIERLTTQLESTRVRLAATETSAATSSETETTLKRMLVSAQRAAERSIEQANERARRIVEQAQHEVELRQHLEAQRGSDEDRLEQRRRELVLEIERLEARASDVRARLRAQLQEQLRVLDDEVEASQPAYREQQG